MDPLFDMIEGTPLWVWLVLCYLIFVGIRALKASIVSLPKLFLIPFLFLAIQYKLFFSSDAAIFIATILLTMLLSFIVHTQKSVEILKTEKAVKLPGSTFLLLTLIFVFVLKYFFGYLKTTAPDLAARYAIINIIISGILSGYFLGRATCYVYKYRKIKDL